MRMMKIVASGWNLIAGVVPGTKSKATGYQSKSGVRTLLPSPAARFAAGAVLCISTSVPTLLFMDEIRRVALVVRCVLSHTVCAG